MTQVGKEGYGRGKMTDPTNLDIAQMQLEAARDRFDRLIEQHGPEIVRWVNVVVSEQTKPPSEQTKLPLLTRDVLEEAVRARCDILDQQAQINRLKRYQQAAQYYEEQKANCLKKADLIRSGGYPIHPTAE